MGVPSCRLKSYQTLACIRLLHLSSFGQRAPERGCSRVLAIVYDNELTASMHVEICYEYKIVMHNDRFWDVTG
jgi:hypothetical protein